MKIINYFSNLAIPLIFLIILLYGIKEKKPVFDIFLEGAKDGIEIVINIFPTLIGLFVAIGVLRSSGILEFIINLISPITNILGFPKEIMPLAILRPISRKCIDCGRNRYNENIWCG
ncbi:MAG: nucleoside recognition domain-containing protein [Clostridia bacterium]